MTEHTGRAGRRLRAAAPLAIAATLLTGCTSPSQAPTPAAAPSAGPAAAAQRNAALSATRALHSYTFTSVTSLGTDITRVTGRAVLPDAVSYTVRKGATTQSVVRIRDTTYVRASPSATWVKRATPARAPLASLTAPLAAADALRLDPAGTTLSATISAAAATRAGLLNAGSSAATLPLTFTLDARGHVTRFTLSAELALSGHTVTLTETTNYATFDQAPTIKAP